MRVQNQRGSLFVELAMVLGLLLVILVGVSDMSAAWRAKHVMNMAAREAARVASVTRDLDAESEAILQDRVDTFILRANLACSSFSRTMEFAQPVSFGDPVSVRLTCGFEPGFLSIIPGIGNSLPLNAASVMRYSVPSSS